MRLLALGMALASGMVGAASLSTAAPLQAKLVATGVSEAAPTQIVLKNDTFNESGGQAYLEQGFVTGEMAGIWVPVPANIPLFKVDSFRVLIGGDAGGSTVQAFFSMTVADAPSTSISPTLQNAAQLTSGSYFNDIPAQGAEGTISLPCVKPGQFVGAAFEFQHDGIPSVYRDLGPVVVQNNLINAIPGGWNYSSSYGIKGNWILRIVGHQADASECSTH